MIRLAVKEAVFGVPMSPCKNLPGTRTLDVAFLQHSLGAT